MYALISLQQLFHIHDKETRTIDPRLTQNIRRINRNHSYCYILTLSVCFERYNTQTYNVAIFKFKCA